MTKIEVLESVEAGNAEKLTLNGKKYWLDMQTAHAIMTVYRSLSDENKAKYVRLSIPSMADVAWKVIAKTRVA